MAKVWSIRVWLLLALLICIAGLSGCGQASSSEVEDANAPGAGTTSEASSNIANKSDESEETSNGLSAYQDESANPAVSGAESLEDIQLQQGNESIYLEAYNVVLSQYKDVEQRKSRHEEITIDSLGEYVNLHIIISGSNEPLVYTALYDVDDNGVPELIVGRDWSNEGDPAVEIEMLDIFTYHEGSVVNVFQGVYEGVYPNMDPVFGLRFSFSVHENGIIAVYGSSGTSMAENEFFEIAPTGKARLLEGVELFYHGDAEEPIYRHYYNLADRRLPAPEITEDEYHSIVSKYIDQEIDQHGVELIWEPLM